MDKKLLIGFVFLFLLALPLVSALPYNVDTSNINVSLFQYFDNETNGDAPIWTSNGGADTVIDYAYNGSSGKSMNITGGDPFTQVTYTQLWGGTRTSGNITYEFDYYMSSNIADGEEMEFYAGDVTNSIKIITLRLARPSGYWEYYDGALHQLGKEWVTDTWEHLKLTCDTSTQNCQIQFNDGTWETVTPRTDQNTAVYGTSIYVASGHSMLVDNYIAYNGTEIPIVTNTLPTVNIETKNNTIFYDKTPEIYFNVSDPEEDTFDCDLYINNTLYGNNGTVAEDTSTSIEANATLTSSGKYEFYVSCSDGTDTNTSETYTLIIPDTINITSTYPENATDFNYNDIVFNYTVDFTYVNTTCSLYINDTLNETKPPYYVDQDFYGVLPSTSSCSFAEGTSGINQTFQLNTTAIYNITIPFYHPYISETHDGMLNISILNSTGSILTSYNNTIYNLGLTLPNSTNYKNITFNFSLSGLQKNTKYIMRIEVYDILPNALAVYGNETANSYPYGNLTTEATCSLKNGGSIYFIINGLGKAEYAKTLSDGAYSYHYVCNDTFGIGETSTTKYFWVDTVLPTSTTNFTNHSLAYATKNLTAFFNFTDETILHSLNITIDNNQIFSNTSMDGTFFEYYLNRNVSNLSIGKHNLTTRVADGHTAEKLKSPRAYNPEANYYVQYNFRKPYPNNYIKVSIKGYKERGLNLFGIRNNDYWQVQQKTDKYIEIVEPAVPKPTQTFVVESNEKIYIKEKKGKYLGKWLVIGDHWKDFVLEDEPDVKINIKRISDYKVEVTLSNIKNPERLKFSSTGDLNIETKTYYFYNINMTTSYNKEILTESENRINLTVDFGELNFSTSGITPEAILEWNATNYTATLLNFNSTEARFTKLFSRNLMNFTGVVNFKWFFNLSPYTNGYLETDTEQQFLRNWSIGNCTNYNNYTITFSIYDEENPNTLLNASADVELTYWYDDPSVNKNYSHGYRNNNTYHICISPDNVTLYADAYFKYKSDKGLYHRYYFYNQSLSANVTTYSFYNFNKNDTSILRITLRDKESYNYFPNIIGKLQRKYIDEGVWRTVQEDKSDDFGLLIYNIIEGSVDYRIIFMDENNNILRTTNSMKFSCDDGVCEVTYTLEPYEAPIGVSEDFNMTWNYYNETGNINVTWENINGEAVNIWFFVRKDTMAESTYICNYTYYVASGDISCNVSAYTGEVFVYIEAEDETQVAEYLKLNTDKIGDLIGQTESAFWTIGIIVVCVAIGMFSPAGAIIGLMFGLIAIYILGLFTPITVTFLIIAGVLSAIIGFKVRN